MSVHPYVLAARLETELELAYLALSGSEENRALAQRHVENAQRIAENIRESV